MHVVIQKPFDANGTKLQTNWLIDASDWPIRRRDQLISQRYVRLASAEEIASANEEDVDDEAPAPTPRRAPRLNRKKKKLTTKKIRRA